MHFSAQLPTDRVTKGAENFVPFGLGMNQKALPDADAFCEQVARLEEIGVTWLSVGVPGPSRAAYCENATRFGAEVIARLRRR